MTEETPSWEWIDNPPTTEEVKQQLSTLQSMWGVRPEDYIDHVIPLSQNKNVAQEKGKKDYRTSWTLYITVAGRIAMVMEAAYAGRLMVDFQPETMTPTHIPGYLVFNENRLVYREYVSIHDLSNEHKPLGSKPGTAWVPMSGGSGAVGSNPFEKVETSARGRALAAWGFGVIPGSGIASLDEVMSAREIAQKPQEPKPPQQDRSDIESQLRVSLAKYQDITSSSDDDMDDKVTAYVGKSFNKEVAKDETTGSWDFSNLKDGELALFKSRIQRELADKENE